MRGKNDIFAYYVKGTRAKKIIHEMKKDNQRMAQRTRCTLLEVYL